MAQVELVILPDGYNGHTVVCLTKPVETDGELVKLAVYGREHLIRWIKQARLGSSYCSTEAC